ncbi:MAG: GAF domain-containing protein [SAR324 cluster bacterium]|nr:GAF domain-containing protein [SAR324 cluster bacterium]
MKQTFETIGIAQNINEFIQKLPLPVAVINLQKEIVAYNRAFFLMAGRDVRQGTHYCHEFLNFPFCEGACLADMAIKMNRTINWDESHGRRKSGEELIVRPMVTPLYTEAGEHDGFVLLFQDTTDEVQLYRNFRANLDHLERKVAFLQTLNDAAEEFRKITSIDLLMQKITDFIVEHLSMEFCQVIQLKEEKYESVSASLSSDPEITEEQKVKLTELAISGIPQINDENMPYCVVHIEKDTVDSIDEGEIVLLPIRSGTKSYGFLANYQLSQAGIPQESLEYLDLFAKSAGPYIENSHIITNLEAIVKERTQALNAAQAQLVESTKLASVGEMAGMVAHEVLNPMTAVLARIRKLYGEEGALEMIKVVAEGWEGDYKEGGFEALLETLKDTPEEGGTPLIEEDLTNLKESVSGVTTDLKFMEEQLNRIVSIVDSLRGLSRGQKTTELIDLATVLDKANDLLSDGLAKRHIKLETKIGHKSQVLCDANEMLQVFHNIFKNSMQAIEKDGFIRVVTTQNEDRVEIRITDSGPGIPPEIAPKIFEMRFTTKSEKEGTGIGLNLSRRLMRQALGDVDLESGGGNGIGATFICWIPLPEKRKDAE